MEPVSGYVSGVSFTPGRGDGLLTLSLTPSGSRLQHQMVMANDPAAELFVEGAYVRLETLVVWLLTHKADVVCHPLTERYGAALKAEFTEHKD